MMHLAVAVLLALAQTNDKAQANGYDDAWKSAWKTHLTTVIAGGTDQDRRLRPASRRLDHPRQPLLPVAP